MTPIEFDLLTLKEFIEVLSNAKGMSQTHEKKSLYFERVCEDFEELAFQSNPVKEELKEQFCIMFLTIWSLMVKVSRQRKVDIYGEIVKMYAKDIEPLPDIEPLTRI